MEASQSGNAPPKSMGSPQAPTPKIDRTVVLHFKGDGTANLHRICGWLGEQVVRRSGPGSRVATWLGTGMLENVLAVANGSVDVAVATPSCAIALACEGRLGGVDAMPQLRALGTIPQFDRLVFAIRSECGFASFDEIRRKRPALRVSAWPDDGDAFIGIGARLLLSAVGMDESKLLEWGGNIVDFPPIRDAAPDALWHERIFGPIRSGAADAVIMEAIMVPAWRDLVRNPGVRFLSLGNEDVRHLVEGSGWPTVTVPAGYFPGQQSEITALEFSDFLVICREDLPEDLAYLISWAMGETRQILEAQYRHLAPDRSPVTYPLDPVAMGQTTIALHRGAARYFQPMQHESNE